MRFNHVGIPTTHSFDGEIPLPHLRMTVSDHLDNPFGIQWQRYWDDAPYPDLMKTVPHVAFEVDDPQAALAGHRVIIEPNSPSVGVIVAFVASTAHGRADADRSRSTPGPVGAGRVPPTVHALVIPASSFSMAWSMVNEGAFWRGGKSSNVARNSPTTPVAASTR